MKETENYNVNVNTSFLREYSLQLYEELVKYPQEIIPLMDVIVNEMYATRYADSPLPATQRIQVRVFNLDEIKPMRELDPSGMYFDLCVQVDAQALTLFPCRYRQASRIAWYNNQDEPNHT